MEGVMETRPRQSQLFRIPPVPRYFVEWSSWRPEIIGDHQPPETWRRSLGWWYDMSPAHAAAAFEMWDTAGYKIQTRVVMVVGTATYASPI